LSSRLDSPVISSISAVAPMPATRTTFVSPSSLRAAKPARDPRVHSLLSHAMKQLELTCRELVA